MHIARNMSNALILPSSQTNVTPRFLYANVYKQVLNASIMFTKTHPLIMLH